MCVFTVSLRIRTIVYYMYNVVSSRMYVARDSSCGSAVAHTLNLQHTSGLYIICILYVGIDPDHYIFVVLIFYPTGLCFVRFV